MCHLVCAIRYFCLIPVPALNDDTSLVLYQYVVDLICASEHSCKAKRSVATLPFGRHSASDACCQQHGRDGST